MTFSSLKCATEIIKKLDMIFVKIRTNSFYNITSNCKVFELAQHQLQLRTFSLQRVILRQLLNGNGGQLRTVILTVGEDSEAAGES